METASHAAGYRFFSILLVLLVAVFGYSMIRKALDLRDGGSGGLVLPSVQEGDPVRGASGAPVTIIEFADFTCEFCAASQPTLTAVLAKHSANVRHAWKDFPLADLHPEARAAAQAARCAQEQGKFWEMHDLLFEHHAALSQSVYTLAAKTLTLNEELFALCMGSGSTLQAIDANILEGQRAGVDGTPTYFVNDLRFTVVPTAEQLEAAILTALNASP